MHGKEFIMPFLIKTIDLLGRQKKRDVLFISFDPRNEECFWLSHFEYEADDMRKQVIAWLDDHQIQWQMCGEVASENSMVSYMGQIYVDVPFDEKDEQYQLVRNHLEHDDGTMRYENVTFWVLPLENAMKNSHHDAPGFWEQWAKDF
jgi:hypothetical protein